MAWTCRLSRTSSGSQWFGSAFPPMCKHLRNTWWEEVIWHLHSCLVLASYWTGYMSLWLKADTNYSVELINVLPTFVYIVSALSSWIGTTLAGAINIPSLWTLQAVSRKKKKKKTSLVTAEPPFKFGMIFPAILMCIWNIPNGLKFFAFYFSGLSQMGSPIFVSDTIADDWVVSDVRDTVFVDKYHSTIQPGRAKFDYQLVYDHGILFLYLGKCFHVWRMHFLIWV